MLDDLRIERYARHILLREVGGVGQERILSSTVEVEGLGEAGCWAATYLALAGVGRLLLVDPRPVPAGGLGPLLPFSEEGRPRDRAAAASIGALNPDVVTSVGAPVPGEMREIAETVRLGGDGIQGVYLVATRGERAVGGWIDGHECVACVEAALEAEDASGTAPPAAALAGSTAASEILAAILQQAPRRRGLWLHRLGEPEAIGACPHGDAA